MLIWDRRSLYFFEPGVSSCTKIQLDLVCSGHTTATIPYTQDFLWTPGQWPQQDLEARIKKFCWFLLCILYTPVSRHQHLGLSGQQGRPRRPQYECLGREKPRPGSSAPGLSLHLWQVTLWRGALSDCRLKASDPRKPSLRILSSDALLRAGTCLLRCRQDP